MNVAQETLGFRRAGLSPALSLLMSAFALPIPPAALSSHLHRPTERSPTNAHLIQTSCISSSCLHDRLDQFVDALVSAAAFKPLNLLRKLASPKRTTSTRSLNQVRIPRFRYLA